MSSSPWQYWLSVQQKQKISTPKNCCFSYCIILHKIQQKMYWKTFSFRSFIKWQQQKIQKSIVASHAWSIYGTWYKLWHWPSIHKQRLLLYYSRAGVLLYVCKGIWKRIAKCFHCHVNIGLKQLAQDFKKVCYLLPCLGTNNLAVNIH